jgi:hypothetical protein
MRRPRFLNTILGVVIAAGCAGDPANPLEPKLEPQVEASLVGSLLKPVTTLLLSCTPLPATSRTVVIGSAGGVVSAGPYTLVVPKGALKAPVPITAEVVSDNVNSVRFSPEGLKFSESATLTMSYSNCFGVGMLLPKKIAYTSEGLKLLEILTSVDIVSQKKVTSSLDHFSRYAIAF